MFNINVKDGTHAGWKSVKPANQPFNCPNCDKDVKAHWVKCPDCGLRPPERG